jgi:hypothetical protein
MYEKPTLHGKYAGATVDPYVEEKKLWCSKSMLLKNPIIRGPEELNNYV